MTNFEPEEVIMTNPDTGITFCARCGQEVPHECRYPNNPVLGVLTGSPIAVLPEPPKGRLDGAWIDGEFIEDGSV